MSLKSSQLQVNSARSEEIHKEFLIDPKYTQEYVEAVYRWEQSQKPSEDRSLESRPSVAIVRGSTGLKSMNNFAMKFRGMTKSRESPGKNKAKLISIVSNHPEIFKMRNFLALRKEILKSESSIKDKEKNKFIVLKEAKKTDADSRKVAANMVDSRDEGHQKYYG